LLLVKDLDKDLCEMLGMPGNLTGQSLRSSFGAVNQQCRVGVGINLRAVMHPDVIVPVDKSKNIVKYKALR
jgi:hypothetical protein